MDNANAVRRLCVEPRTTIDERAFIEALDGAPVAAKDVRSGTGFCLVERSAAGRYVRTLGFFRTRQDARAHKASVKRWIASGGSVGSAYRAPLRREG